MYYKSRKNEIIGDDGIQIAIILPSNCSKKDTWKMAAFAAQQMNHEFRRKELEKQAKKVKP